jgi:hypothetical protein
MLAVFVSVHGAIFINWLPPGERFNSGYFCQQILKPPSQILHNERATGSARPVVYCGNATFHQSVGNEKCSQSRQFRRAPRPPSGRDISPCDFFSFGGLKTKLKSEQFDTMEALQRRVPGRYAPGNQIQSNQRTRKFAKTTPCHKKLCPLEWQCSSYKRVADAQVNKPFEAQFGQMQNVLDHPTSDTARGDSYQRTNPRETAAGDLRFLLLFRSNNRQMGAKLEQRSAIP